ncbi:FAD-dependent oxidoreductase [Limosilactobacillus sp.]|uniref:oxidoreductase n=1 Tax=Limosilactobacillus sp. TaxID=2773925 RepID=UPI003EFE14EB
MELMKLKEPGYIGKLWLKNRMSMPAMETWTATTNGMVTQATINHYTRRANGGVALIITEMTNPTPGCVTFPGELDASQDKFLPGLSRLARGIHTGGALAVLQLCHGGVFARGASSEQLPYTPSGIGTASLPGVKLKVMTKDDIKRVETDYAKAALRAKTAGFDGVELHCGHGYLQVEFLSAYYNHRNDEYGGSVYNRLRFSLEIIDKIHEYCGKDFPILFKLSAEDYVPNGITLDQSKEIVKYLEEAGVDAITVTGGTLDSRMQDYLDVMDGKKKINEEKMQLTRGIGCDTWMPNTYSPRAIYAHNAAVLHQYTNVPIITVAGIRPEKANQMISDGQAEFAAIGRQILADPDYPNKVINNHTADIRQCLRCNECLGAGNKNCTIHCAVNPNLGNDLTETAILHPVSTPKEIAVVGSGPAGMNAALAAARRGHHVTLYEKQNRLGGLMYYVGLPKFKIDYQKFTDYLIRQVAKEETIEVKLNTPFTLETAKAHHYDKIIAATGSEWFIPNIPGAHDQGILNPLEVLDGKFPDVENFLVCGAGLVGCEVAMSLAEQGKKVTVLDIVPNSNPANLYGVDWSINARLKADNVKVELQKKILHMSANEVVVATKKEEAPYFFNTGKGKEKPYDLSGPYDGGEESFKGDAVICALGMRSVNQVAKDLMANHFPVEVTVEVIGDAIQPRKILDAVHEGYQVGRRI